MIARKSLLFVLASIGLAAAATPATAQSLMAQPSATDVALAYPERALEEGVGGAATIACVIARSGLLDQCEVVAEEPAEYEFGAAALSIMRHFRYASVNDRGESVVGMRKRLVVRFSLPDNASEPASRDPQP